MNGNEPFRQSFAYFWTEGRMNIVENIKQLEIFDREALNTFPKDGRQLICRFEERKNDNPNMNWFAEVYFVVSEGIVVAAQLGVKSFSDPQPKIKVSLS